MSDNRTPDRDTEPASSDSEETVGQVMRRVQQALGEPTPDKLSVLLGMAIQTIIRNGRPASEVTELCVDYIRHYSHMHEHGLKPAREERH